jgi:hypothetical protein
VPTLFIADFLHHVVRQLDLSSGALATTAGTAAPGFSGDGGDPAKAVLDGPRGVVLRPIVIGPQESIEELLVADTFSNRLRVIGTPRLGPAVVDVGSADRDHPAHVPALLENDGAGMLRLGSVTVAPGSDPGFSGGGDCGNGGQTATRRAPLVNRATCEVGVDFVALRPGVASPFTGQLTVVDGAGVSHPIALTAEVPGIGDVPPVDFQFVDINSAAGADRPVRVTNTGSAPLAVGGIVVTGAFTTSFPDAGCPNTAFTLAPGAACEFNVHFQPATTGSQTGTLTIGHNVPGGDTSVTVTGTGFDSTAPR